MVPPRFRPLLDETRPVAERFAAAGRRLYLVGGVVRDALLGRGRASNDIDLTTDARPDEIERLLRELGPDAVWTQGRRFGTIGARVAGRDFEVTTHRAEVYTEDSRKPEVAFASDVEADLSRRDFTVNAMALDLAELRLVDPFDGAVDLAAKRLRTPLAPEISFTDDPLRMLRAARFISTYGFEPVPELTEAVTALRGRLEIVSAERIRAELDRLITAPSPAAGLWFVVRTGLSEEFLPELPAMAVEQDPIHRHKDVLEHTIAVVEKTSPDRVVRLAALFHDIAKPKTRSIGPNGVSFHHHDVVGARMTRDRMRALKYSNDDVADVSELVALHLRFHTYSMGWTDAAVRRYVRDAGPLLDRLNELTRCDCTTRNPRKAAALARRMDELEARIAELRAQEELESIRPDLDGNDVMALLGVRPGRVVGDALTMLLEARLEEGPLGTEEATRRLRAWWDALPADTQARARTILRRLMRVVLVHAHPDDASYSRALRDAALRGLEQGGHVVDVIDLYGEGFDAAMSRAERLAYETGSPILDPAVDAHARLVAEAQALVFVYPTWWWGLPAVLKGWLERVMVPGVSFRLDPKTNRFRPGLGNLRRIVGISTYGSSRTYMRLFNDAGRRTLTRCVRLSAPSLRCRSRWFGLYAIDASTADERAAFLAKVEKAMAGL